MKKQGYSFFRKVIIYLQYIFVLPVLYAYEFIGYLIRKYILK